MSSRPTAAPPTAATRKPKVAPPADAVPPMAASPTRRQVMAVASLTSDSPSRMVTSFRGSPTRRAIVVAATASGGATTAPSVNATAKLTGRISQVIRPTPSAVTTTSSTERPAMGRRFARKSITEVRIAAAYSNGGRKPSRMISGDSRGTLMVGTNETPIPATISSNGAENLIRLASAVTASTMVAMATMLRAVCTRPCFHFRVSVPAQADADGSALLSSPDVNDLLVAAVEHAGGQLVSWRLDHIDASPRRSTTATYLASVDWPTGRRSELLGASARAGGRSGNDERAVIFGDGDREVAVWLYPDDPDLPGLRRAAVPTELAELFTSYGVVDGPLDGEHLTVEMISYRPRRRAVLKAVINSGPQPTSYFVKVLREPVFGPTLERHELLVRAGLPAPVVAAATPDFLVVLRELPGRPLARAIFDEPIPCTAENLIMLLDSMPAAVAALPRRPPWADAVASYAEMIGAALPSVEPRLRWLVSEISGGLAGQELGTGAHPRRLPRGPALRRPAA